MDKIIKYRNWIKELLTAYTTSGSKSDDQTEEQLIFDEARDHYQLFAVGWQGQRRVYFCLFHLDIKNGKIWLQENSTDYNIVDDLILHGVPHSDVVIGFLPADVRARKEFAVA